MAVASNLQAPKRHQNSTLRSRWIGEDWCVTPWCQDVCHALCPCLASEVYMSFYSFRKVGEVEHLETTSLCCEHLDTTCLCCKNFSLTSTGGLQPLCHHWLTWLQRRGAGHIAIDDTWYVRLQITLIGLAFWMGSDFGPKCPHVPQTMAYAKAGLYLLQAKTCCSVLVPLSSDLFWASLVIFIRLHLGHSLQAPGCNDHSLMNHESF